MDVKNLVMAVVGMVLAAVMIGGALLPAVSSALDDERTIVNNPVDNSNYSVIKMPSDDETHVITWVPRSNVMYVDGAEVSVGAYNSYMTISNVILVKVSINGSIGFNTVDSSGVFDESTTLVTVTIVGSTVTLATNGTDPINVVKTGVEWYALPDSDGLYKLTQQPESTSDRMYYLNSIDQIYGYMVVSTNSLGWVTFAGDVATLPDGTKETMMWDYQKDERFVDLYTGSAYDGYYLNPDYLTNANGAVIAPYFMLIPTEILAHTEQQAVISALYEVIPIVVVAGLVMAGIYVFISRK